MSNTGRTFFTANSKTGRRIAAAQTPVNPFDRIKQSLEIAVWNKAIDDKNAAKHKAKLALLDKRI